MNHSGNRIMKYSMSIHKAIIPLQLQKNPLGIEKMVNDLSSNKNIFDKAKPDFQDALRKSGYDYELEYKDKNKSKRKRRR